MKLVPILKVARSCIFIAALAGGPMLTVSAETLNTLNSAEEIPTRQSITALIDEFVAAWNFHDAKRISAVFTDDGDFIGITGNEWNDPKKIYEVHSGLFKGRYDKSVYAITGTPEINIISPDVAIAHWRWSIKDVRDVNGKTLPTYAGIFTWVLVKSGNTWKVRSAQNNTITQS